MPEVEDFAAELVNEITPSTVRVLGYWLACTIVVVSVFITKGFADDARDQEKYQELSGLVEKLTVSVSDLKDSNIRTDAEVEKNLQLADLVHSDYDRRFMELISRLDDAISRIKP